MTHSRGMWAILWIVVGLTCGALAQTTDLAAAAPTADLPAQLHGQARLIAGTVVAPPDLAGAIANALGERGAGSPSATHYAITDLRAAGDWQLVSIAGLAGLIDSTSWNIEDHGVWFGLAIARRTQAGAWQTGVQGSPTFARLLTQMPEHILPSAARQRLVSSGSQAASEQSGVRFPWLPGTRMLYGQLGVHPNGFAGVVNGWQAVDWVSDGNTAAGRAPNLVLAGAPGVIDYVCRDPGRQVSFKIGSLFYTHLRDRADIYVGRAVSAGEELGALKTGTFSLPCGYGWQDQGWFHLHWGFADPAQLAVEGWTLSYTHSITNWTWVKGSELGQPGESWLPAGAETHAALTPRAFIPFVTQPPREARVLWISRFDWCGTPPCDRARLESLIHKAADARFNMVLFQVRATGDAYYTPGLEPWSYRLTGNTTHTLGTDPGWDPLAVAIETAHARGLQLHAYVNMYSTWECGKWFPPTGTLPLHPFWTLGYYQPPPAPYTYSSSWRVYSDTASGPQPMSVLTSGAPVPCSEYLWASPGVVRVNEHNLAVIKDIVARYDVDGIHMDRVRYPGRQYSPDPESRAAYSAALTLSPTLSYADWQRDTLTRWMMRIYSEVKAIKPHVKLSAAVWFTYKKTPLVTFPTTEGFSDYYQDSHRWLNEGALDAIAPMIYGTTFNSDFDKWRVLAEDHVDVQNNREVWLGIGAAITSSVEINNRIAYARRIGAKGVAIWSAGAMETNQYWDDFADGPFREPAAPP
ncbi:MAG: family 10 glycosylhydrolase [Anaerolineae bacterium]|nr:family 10 glycosylhydrolase [Thermoflexales bacterium]MDW8407208.1 family 10 glycosylhydrolase [Anaerolineae bacterium]